ncbi:unnamed protein product [Urochloa humidicola]
MEGSRLQIAPAGRCNGPPLPTGRSEHECNQLRQATGIAALGHPDHLEQLGRSSHCSRRLTLAEGSKEHIASLLTIHGVRAVDSRCQVLGDWRKKRVAAEQGVADRNGGEGRIRTLVAVEDEAAAEGVADHREARAWEERELEVGGLSERAGGAGERVGWLDDGVELRGEGGKPRSDGGWSARRRWRNARPVMTRRKVGQDAQARPKSSRVGRRMRMSARRSSSMGSASPSGSAIAGGTADAGEARGGWGLGIWREGDLGEATGIGRLGFGGFRARARES